MREGGRELGGGVRVGMAGSLVGRWKEVYGDR